MRAPSTEIELPLPPPDRARAVRWICGLFAVGAGGLAAADASLSLGVISAVFAGFGYLLVLGRRREKGAHLAMAALDRAARGRFDEARGLLDAISPNVLGSYVGQMVDSQRAALALYEGDIEAAVAHATKGAREGKRVSLMGRVHRSSALSLRAVALAALGRKEACLSDVAMVRAAEYRQGSFLARAALAESMLFAREKDLESLARVLREEGPLLFGATSMRERMIARALARMVAAKRVSVYREAAKRDEEELGENDSWVARLAPEAATYAKAPKLGTSLSAPERVNPVELAQAEKLGPKPTSRAKRLAGLWALLVVVFLVAWQALGQAVSPGAGATETTSRGGLAVAWPLATLLLAALFIGFKYARAKRATTELTQAMEKRLRGLREEAQMRLGELAKSTVPLIQPQAERELAAIATAEGEFRRAQDHAAAGVAGTRKNARVHALSRSLLLPSLQGELALAFAADGNAARAEEELDKLRFVPSYPFLARDTFRVRLVAAAAQGHLVEAAEMARSRPVDLPLSMNEELLCDALRVHAGDVLPSGERERILLELREAPPGKFLDRVAPTLRNAAPSAHVRIAPDEPAAVDAEEADTSAGTRASAHPLRGAVTRS